MFDKLINSIAERVTVRVVDMLERRLPEIITTITMVAVGEVLKRLNIPTLPQSDVRNAVNDVLARLGVRR